MSRETGQSVSVIRQLLLVRHRGGGGVGGVDVQGSRGWETDPPLKQQNVPASPAVFDQIHCVSMERYQICPKTV